MVPALAAVAYDKLLQEFHSDAIARLDASLPRV
jgi:hypothetical protein